VIFSPDSVDFLEMYSKAFVQSTVILACISGVEGAVQVATAVFLRKLILELPQIQENAKKEINPIEKNQ